MARLQPDQESGSHRLGGYIKMASTARRDADVQNSDRRKVCKRVLHALAVVAAGRFVIVAVGGVLWSRRDEVRQELAA
jgi:hypothetical protein